MTHLKEVQKVAVPCEVYSRVCGYFRPTNQWNPGKKEEFKDRNGYNQKGIKKALCKQK